MTLFQRGRTGLPKSMSTGYVALLTVYGMVTVRKSRTVTKVQLVFILFSQVFYFVTVSNTAIKYWIRQHSSSYIHDSFSNFSYMLDTATAIIETIFLLTRGHLLRDTIDKFTSEMTKLDKGTRGHHLLAMSQRLFLFGITTGLTQLAIMISSIWLKPEGSVETFAQSYLWQMDTAPEHMLSYGILQDTYDITYICFIDMFFCAFLNYFIFCGYVCYKSFQLFNDSVSRKYANKISVLNEDVALVMKCHRKMAGLVAEVNGLTSTPIFVIVMLMSCKICVAVRATSGVRSIWEVIDIVSIFFSTAYLLGFFFVSAMLNAEAHKIPEILMSCAQNHKPTFNEKVFISSTVLWTELSANPIGLKASRYILLSYSFITMTFGTIITYSIILYEMAK